MSLGETGTSGHESNLTRTIIHGFEAVLPAGSDYPEIVRRFPWFNAPVVELVQQMHVALGRAVNTVDVGAAVGDTVLLLKQRCPAAVGSILCVEGDAEFFRVLEQNTSRFADVTALQRLLARADGVIPSLVKHRHATATATGAGCEEAWRLDSLAEIGNAVDVLKVDVDGFDGEVLAGATRLLERCRPAVIFEWHPRLLAETGNDPLAAFETLALCGFDRYLWFTNVGTFSHFEQGYSTVALLKLASYLQKVTSRADEHFDVVALHRDLQMDEVGLAAMEFARAASAMG